MWYNSESSEEEETATYIQQAQPRMAHPNWDSNTMEVGKINLSLAKRAEHM